MAGKYEIYDVASDSPEQPQNKYQVFNQQQQQPAPGTQFDISSGSPQRVVSGEEYRSEQSLPSYLTDLAAIGLAGPTEFFSELPGNISSIIHDVGNRISGKGKERGTYEELPIRLPVSGEVGGALSKLTGGRTEPKVQWERNYKDLMANFATFLAPDVFRKKPITPYSAGVAGAKAVGSEATKHLVKEFGGGTAAQAIGQALFASAANTAGTRKLLTDEAEALRNEVNPVMQSKFGSTKDTIKRLRDYRAEIVSGDKPDKDFILARIDGALKSFESPLVQETERQVIHGIEEGRYPNLATGKPGNPAPAKNIFNQNEWYDELLKGEKKESFHANPKPMVARTGGFEGEPIKVDRVKSGRIKEVAPIVKEEMPIAQGAAARTNLGKWYEDPKLTKTGREGLNKIYAIMSDFVEDNMKDLPDDLAKWQKATDIERGLLSQSMITRLLDAASTLDPRKFDLKSATAKALLYGPGALASGFGSGGVKALGGAIAGSQVAHQFSRAIDFVANSKSAQNAYLRFAREGLSHNIPMMTKMIHKIDKEALEYEKKHRKENGVKIRVN